MKVTCPKCSSTVTTWAVVDLRKVLDGTDDGRTWRYCPRCGESVPFPEEGARGHDASTR